MECKYGERGSLTVYCINATASYIKTSRYRYDHLDETLKCVNCKLDRLEEGTFDISGNQLKAVDIRNSSIKVIYQKAFIGLVFMESLYLSTNSITKIYPGAFSGIRKVKYLEMENAISQLQADVFKELILLNILILRNNNFASIEDGTFTGLRNLKILDLSNNKLAALGKIFKPLVNLELLKIQNNLLRQIDGDEFASLPHLIGLYLDNNRIQTIESIVPAENRLRILNLNANNLTENSVKSGVFQNMNSLEELDFGLNSFSSFPPKFFQGLYRLRILNLFGNSMKEFSTGRFSGLPHLRSLNFSQNRLESAKATGRLVLTNLYQLDLSKNQIRSFDYISLMRRFPKLSQIDLSHNDLSCKLLVAIRRFLEKESIHILGSDENLKQCSNDPKMTDEIMKAEVVDYQDENGMNAFMIVMLVVIVIIIACVFILYYVEFIVLSRLRQSTYDVRVLGR